MHAVGRKKKPVGKIQEGLLAKTAGLVTLLAFLGSCSLCTDFVDTCQLLLDAIACGYVIKAAFGSTICVFCTALLLASTSRSVTSGFVEDFASIATHTTVTGGTSLFAVRNAVLREV